MQLLAFSVESGDCEAMVGRADQFSGIGACDDVSAGAGLIAVVRGPLLLGLGLGLVLVRGPLLPAVGSSGPALLGILCESQCYAIQRI